MSGLTVSLQLLSVKSLRSAFVVDPNDYEWELFTYSRSQPVAGSSRYASRADTNVPKSGYNGLPTGWRFSMLNWRAAAGLPLEQPLLDWANETSVEFVYNETHRSDARLADLLFGAQCVGLDGLPIDLREHLNYKVTVRVENNKAHLALHEWLRKSHVADYLDQLAAQFDGHRAEILAKKIELCPARELKCWVYLEGIMSQELVL